MLTEERAGEKRYRWLLRRRNNKARRKAWLCSGMRRCLTRRFARCLIKPGCYQELDGRHLFVRHSKFM